MGYIEAADIQKAKEMDLLTYLRNYEPQELVHVSGNTYCTKEHDSLRISNGKWCWFSQGIGGRSALDYLIKVKGLSFTQAVENILDYTAVKEPIFYRSKEKKQTKLLIPKLSESTQNVERYLESRGIHRIIIRYCIEHKLLFESADYHNAVFIGYDRDGNARYGSLRSTTGSYKSDITGSDKHFSFSLEGNSETEEVHVFESAIDLLSFEDIINLPHHVSKTRPKMPMSDRAAQFAPFAALTGYDDAVKETGRLTDDKIELEENSLNELNAKIQLLRENLVNTPEITFTYFKPDERKAGGAYLTITGTVKKLDDYERQIVLHDGTKLPMDDVLEINGDIFGMIE